MAPVQYQDLGRTAKQIATGLEDAVHVGSLRAGESLPSVRALADRLGVAPGTVASAYRTLRDRGVVRTRGRNGTVVNAPHGGSDRITQGVPSSGGTVVDLASGQPAADLLPRLPARLRGSPLVPAVPEGPVLPLLRRTATDLLEADGVPAEHLTVTSGAMDAIRHLLAGRLRLGDAVAVEDPGWPNVLDAVASLGLRAVPVALDAEGPRPASVTAALDAGARAVVVTCRAQNPTGHSVTPDRSAALRGVLAAHPETLVIEDDHAAELMDGRPALVAGATPSWAFVRSVSKPYGPDLRLAVVAGDERTVAGIERQQQAGPGWVSTLLQRLVVAQWDSAEANEAVAHAAETYDRRRRALVDACAADGVVASGAAGLNVWVPVADETAVVGGLALAGWAVAPGARFRQVSEPGVRITVGNLTDVSAPRLAEDLLRVLRQRPTPAYAT